MKIVCDLQIQYGDSKKAKMVLQSINVDDFDFVTSKTNKSVLMATIKSTSVPSLVHTLDDYLACLSVAEKIVDKN